jgi:hypothetical protein
MYQLHLEFDYLILCMVLIRDKRSDAQLFPLCRTLMAIKNGQKTDIIYNLFGGTHIPKKVLTI